MRTPDHGGLRVETIATLDALQALAPELRDLVAVTGALVYNHPAFLMPWSRAAVANGMRPACLALRRGRELTGFAPLFVKRDPRALMARRLSTPRYGTSPPFEILLTGDEAEGVDAFGRAVLRQSWLDQSFALAVEGSRIAGAWPDWFAARGFDVERRSEQPYLNVQLDANPGRALDFVQRKTRMELERLRRRLDAEATTETYRGDGPLQPALETMTQVIQTSWKNSAEMNQRGLAVLIDLARGLDAEGLLQLRFVHFEGRPVAYLMEILDATGTRHAYHNAFDPGSARLSPGIMILEQAIREAAADGCRIYDFWGNRDYFRKLSNGFRTSVSVTIQNRGLLAHAQARFLRVAGRGRAGDGRNVASESAAGRPTADPGRTAYRPAILWPHDWADFPRY